MNDPWDYSNALHANADQARDPWGGKVPTDAKEYAAFRRYHENTMLEMMGGTGALTLSATCEGRDAKGRPKVLHVPKAGHFGCGIAMACDHVIHQDPENPEGIWFVPLIKNTATGYWLCRACFRAFQAYHFNLDHVRGKCAKCVVESIEKVQALHPDRIHDLTLE